MNAGAVFRLQKLWSEFSKRHPKFPMFLTALSRTQMTPGTIVEFHISTPEGKDMTSNVKLTPEDCDMIREISGMGK